MHTGKGPVKMLGTVIDPHREGIQSDAIEMAVGKSPFRSHGEEPRPEIVIHDDLVQPEEEDVLSYNVGSSDYAKHSIQPWMIWLEYGLNPWDADIVKRVLRTKEGDSRKLDYEKMIHICKERIRQINLGYK